MKNAFYFTFGNILKVVPRIFRDFVSKKKNSFREFLITLLHNISLPTSFLTELTIFLAIPLPNLE